MKRRLRSALRSSRLSLMCFTALLVLGTIGILPAAAQADAITAAFPSFTPSNIQALNLNGTAALEGDWLRLTPSVHDVSGAAWWLHKVDLGEDRSFSAYFTFRTQDPNPILGGADGITFTVQQTSNSALTGGYGIGYYGITPSVAVELDTWMNDWDFLDINGNHVGIDRDGSIISVASTPAPWNLKDGSTYHVWVDYNGVTDVLEVRLNTSIARPPLPLLSYTVDLASDIDQQVYVGFTSATGGAWECHDIGSMYFNNDYTPLDPANVTYTTAATALALDAADPVVQPGHTTALTATATDPVGNPVPGQTVTFSTSDGSVDPLTAVTGADGTATTTITAPSADGPVTVTATSDGGAYGTADVVVDGTPPTTYAKGLDDDPGLDWVADDHIVYLKGDDGEGGSGVAQTYFIIDGGDTQTYDDAIHVTGDGWHSVSYWSVDAAGNIEDSHVGYVGIDAAAPVVTVTGVDSRWHRTVVAATITATEIAAETPGLGKPAPAPGSGVKQVQFREGDGKWVTVDGDTAHVRVTKTGVHTFQYRAEDNLGNVSAPKSFTIKFDTVKPHVTCITNTVVRQGDVAKLSYRLSDNLSTSLACKVVITQYGKTKAVTQLGSKPVGKRLVASVRATLRPQWYYWRVVARDAAGNEYWGSHRFLIISRQLIR